MSLVPLRTTTSLMVILGSQGVHLVNPSQSQPILLKYHELLTISEIHANECVDEDELASIVADLASVEVTEVKQFVRSLVRTGRIRRRLRTVPSPELPPANLPASSNALSFDQGLLALKVPLALRMFCGNYQLIDHDGGLIITLNPAEVIAVSHFANATRFAVARKKQQETLSGKAVSEERLKAILTLLEGVGLLSAVEADEQGQVVAPQKLTRTQAKKESFAKQAADQDRAEAEREKSSGTYRPKVIPVSFDQGVPAALGMIYAYAKAYGDGCLDEFYNFRLDWVWDDDRLEGFTSKPAIYLCSNYLWSHEESIGASEVVKRLSPDSITIHGGPDTPKYPKDAEAYFESYPHVDIIVRGEGEATAAEVLDKLRSVIGQKNPDLSVLEGVEGISYRHHGEIVRNPDRARIADLDLIPSPYIAGLFDAFKNIPRLHVTLETNRGCPYGCTFCDWGSATTSKIRKFDLDRIYGELEWCSQSKVQSVSVADANFGVFERDVSIAQKVSDLKRASGFPEAFGGSYAKNSTKYLQKIIRVMAEADILTQGVLSLQTMDENTLSVIQRSNIKVEKYDALANEMRDANLQLTVELMMALPGATLQSFIEDLQQCIDRDIQARINDTTLLVNSPMNAPEYRAEHEIVTGSELGPGKMPILVSTKTFTREDHDKMLAIRNLYLLLDNFGVLRLCSRFVLQQTGIREMEFYGNLLMDVGHEKQERTWPILNTLVNMVENLMAPPFSWALMIEELRRYMIEVLKVPDDSALDTIMQAQHALLPAFGRTYPTTLELKHDVVAWHDEMLAAKSAGHWRDWHTVIPPLAEFSAGRMTVNDVDGWVTSILGGDLRMSSAGVNWDMDSGIGRARVSQEFNSAWEAEDVDVIQVG